MARGSASTSGRRKTTRTAAAKPVAAKPGGANVRAKTASGERAAKKPAPSRAQARESGASASPVARGAPASPAVAATSAAIPPVVPAISIRPVRPVDLAQVIAIDSIVTGLEKAEYWRTIHRRYGDAERAGRRFLVAEANGSVAGFVIGEVRDWEFGSPPCGWVFAIDVHPQFRLAGLGTQLVGALADWFRREGVDTMRTILARDNTLILSFFRSLGMTTGPFIPLEIDLHSDFFPLDRDRPR